MPSLFVHTVNDSHGIQRWASSLYRKLHFSKVNQETMATPEQANKEHARRFNEEVWGKSNFEAIGHLVAEDFVGHNPALPEPVRGADGVREVAEMLYAAFPDCEVELEQVIADGDWLAQRVTVTATHEGEFMGIEPTGEEVEVTGMNITRLEDSKWAEGYELWDMFGLLHQLGVVEQPGE